MEVSDSIKNISNKFAAIGSDPVFYTFSSYTNDLVTNINGDGMSIARPSRFICLNLKNLSNITNDLQDYEYGLSAFRYNDTEEDNKEYKNYFLGGLLATLCKNGYMDNDYTYTPAKDAVYYQATDEEVIAGKAIEGQIKEAEVKESFTISDFASNTIDVFGDEVIEGNSYDEIICYLGPNDNDKYNLTPIPVSSTNTTVCNISTTVDDAGKESITFPEYVIKQQSSSFEESFEFNTVIVLYDVELGDSGDTYTDIPLGIYINPNKTFTKSASNDVIYEQGTSYALKICTRFAATSGNDNYLTETSGADVVMNIADIKKWNDALDKMNDTIDKMNDMISSFNTYNQNVTDHISSYEMVGYGTRWLDYSDGNKNEIDKVASMIYKSIFGI